MTSIDFGKFDENALRDFLKKHRIGENGVPAAIFWAVDHIAYEARPERYASVARKLLDDTLEKADHEILKNFDRLLIDPVKIFPDHNSPAAQETASQYEQARLAINALCRLKGIIMHPVNARVTA